MTSTLLYTQNHNNYIREQQKKTAPGRRWQKLDICRRFR